MLGAAHVGYTLGACWLADKLIPGKRHIDYRAVAAAALAPDIMDRLLYVFAMPRAASGRLMAHTAVFQLAMGAAACAMWPKVLPYAMASAFHLVLDSTRIHVRWLRHVFYPIGGLALRHINIEDHPVDPRPSYLAWVRSRLEKGSGPYRHASKSAWAFELSGAAIIAAFVAGACFRRRSSDQDLDL